MKCLIYFNHQPPIVDIDSKDLEDIDLRDSASKPSFALFANASFNANNNASSLAPLLIKSLRLNTPLSYKQVLSIPLGPSRMRLQLPQNVRKKGSDNALGDLLIESGSKINAADVGILATVGLANVEVKRKCSVAIVSSGDELVPVDQKPLEHQIRRSNVYSIESALDQDLAETRLYHLTDELSDIKIRLSEILSNHQVVILSGGVSKGKFDYIPDALHDLGVEKLFHKVAQRPGKPFWFGSTKGGPVVFALPGNPVSTLMCVLRYVRPFLNSSLDLEQLEQYAILEQDFSFGPELNYFLQVKVAETAGGFRLATPIPGRGSGDLANMSLVNGFIELPFDKSDFKKGECYPYWPIP